LWKWKEIVPLPVIIIGFSPVSRWKSYDCDLPAGTLNVVLPLIIFMEAAALIAGRNVLAPGLYNVTSLLLFTSNSVSCATSRRKLKSSQISYAFFCLTNKNE